MSESTKPQSPFTEAAVYTGANIINAVIPFLLLPILTRILSPAEYGLVAMFQTVLAIFGVFTGAGFHAAVRTRYFKMDSDRFPVYTGVCMLLMTLTTMITLGVVTLLLEPLAAFTSLDTNLLLLAVIVSAMQFYAQIRLVIWQVKRKPFAYSIFQILQSIMNLGLSLYLVVALSEGAQGRINGIAITIFVFGLIAIITLFYTRQAKPGLNRDDAVSALKFSLPLIPYSLTAMLVLMADRFILNSTLGVESVGIYFVALQLAIPITVITDGINRAFTPWCYEKMQREHHHFMIATTYLLMLIFVAITLLYCISIYFLFDIIVGPTYQQGITITLILAVAACLHACTMMVSKGVFYAEKTERLPLITITLGASYIVVAIAMVENFGLLGLACSYLGYKLISMPVFWKVSYHAYPQPWTDFSPVFAEVKRIIATLITSFLKKIS